MKKLITSDKTITINGVTKTLGTDITFTIAASGGTTLNSTNDLPEGTTNKYYTDARVNSVVTPLLTNKVDKVSGKGLSTEDYTTLDKTKLGGISTGATVNSTDANLRDRTTHTGVQAISTISSLQTALDAKQATLVSGTNVKTINGVTLLGSGDISITGSSSTTVQSVRDTWPVVTVATPTLANVQSAIDSAVSTGTRIKLGAYTGSIAGFLSINGKSIWLDGQGICNWIRSDGPLMIEVKGTCPKSRISGMNLPNLNSNTNDVSAVVATYEISKIDDFEFDNNYISCPLLSGNAFGISQYSTPNAANSLRSTNINIHHNRFIRCGRMGAEILAQASGDNTVAAYLTNVTFAYNHVEDTGRVNLSSHGMGVSFDGLIDNLIIEYNTFIEVKNRSIEVVNCRNAIVRNNKVKNIINQDVVGFSQSVGNSPLTYGLLVENNDIETTGPLYNYADIVGLKMYKNIGICRVSNNPIQNRGLYLTRSNGGIIQGNTIRNAGVNGIMLDNSPNNFISGNTFTNEFNYLQQRVVYLFGSNTTGNTFIANNIAKYAGAYKNSTYIIEGGTSGNNYSNNPIVTEKLARQPSLGTNGVILLLHGQGEVNTDIVDSSPVPKPVYKIGNPLISTTQFKYGGSSLYFDGSSALVIPKNNDWTLGTGDFTMEAFLYPVAHPASSVFPSIVCRQTATNVSWTWGIKENNSALDFNIVNNSDAYTGPGPTSSTALTLNAWSHVAIVSSGGTRRLYLNGNQLVSSSTVTSMELNTNGQNLLVGSQNSEANYYTGYMHLKITKGSGLYTGTTYTQPTSF